jgi:hypothetical protein
MALSRVDDLADDTQISLTLNDESEPSGKRYIINLPKKQNPQVSHSFLESS